MFNFSDEIKKAWDQGKSVFQNLKEMGISADPNKTLKVPHSKAVKMGMMNIEMEAEITQSPIKNFVMKELEEKSKIPAAKKFTMSDEDAGFCVYLMDKYGENYKGMARDERNYFQETPKQLQRKINRFKSIPEMYRIYAEAKQGEATFRTKSGPR
ncbi:Nucleolar protein 16 [Bulinus truncatus]|nr:Nucleolar protein 16 [Bulinus truncatus]